MQISYMVDWSAASIRLTKSLWESVEKGMVLAECYFQHQACPDTCDDITHSPDISRPVFMFSVGLSNSPGRLFLLSSL